ncbi:MAG: YitT family protein [Acutalibacteraceae bacterium]|nr:YitT family protein [Acutalibacteraceae bacterium]
MNGDNSNVLKTVKEYLFLTFGTAVFSSGTYFFKLPNNFYFGGISGLAPILAKFTPLSSATWVSVMTCVCLLIGFIVLGKETGVRTVFCSLLFSGINQMLEFIIPLSKPLTSQPLLELVYAILMTSIGAAIIFKYNGSTGGNEIFALIIKKYFPISIGKALLTVDFIITISSFFVFDFTVGMFSLLGLFCKAFLVDGVIENMNGCKYFMIVTTHPEEISEYIISQMQHSATLVNATGAFTHNDKTALHTVCRRYEAIQLQKFVRKTDPSAFMIITTSSEIIGRGFLTVN